MPISTASAEVTLEMRTTSALLVATGHPSLAAFIAERRTPGPSWKSWEAIALDLYQATGVPVTRECPRRWAARYGIPNDTRASDGADLTTAYAQALHEVGVPCSITVRKDVRTT